MFIYEVLDDRYIAIIFADSSYEAEQFFRERVGEWVDIKETNKLGVVTADVSNQYIRSIHRIELR